MKVTIYSKEGCEYCGHAVRLCESEGLEYEKKMVDRETLKSLCGKSAATYPQISIDGNLVGTYFNFQDFLEDEYEPILAQTLDRFTVFPLQHPHLWQLYKQAQMSNWTAEEIDLSKDMEDWERGRATKHEGLDACGRECFTTHASLDARETESAAKH